MNPAVAASIQGALYARLQVLQLPQALPIAPEGKAFDGKGKPYLRPTFLPAETTSEEIADTGDEIHSGLFQVDVFWPIDKGVTEPLTVAGAVARHYPRGWRPAIAGIDLRIPRPASVLPSQQETALLMIPVRIPWWASAEVTVTA